MIDRREFLQRSALAGTVLVIGSEASFGAEPEIELEEATVSGLQAAMSTGQTTARKVAEGYLARIASIDKKPNSIIELNLDALVIADQMDKERKAGKTRGPLHGIPVVIKDNIDTADKMKTTAGSLALIDAPTPRQDAFIVKQLREAGAVILGKTNLSKCANFLSSKSSTHSSVPS